MCTTYPDFLILQSFVLTQITKAARANPAMHAALQEMRGEQPFGRKSLGALLILPLQRAIGYTMLIKRAAKHDRRIAGNEAEADRLDELERGVLDAVKTMNESLFTTGLGLGTHSWSSPRGVCWMLSTSTR